MGMQTAGFSFEIQYRSGAARAGVLRTPHGVVETPAFMPVASAGAVRGIDVGELRQMGAQLLLANTYHLSERPGEKTVRVLGGLHGFTGWRGPWLTDSGGYQLTSLAARAKLDEEGICFASPRDGRRRKLTPENAVAIQADLGGDIAMVLDECRPLAQLGRDPGDAAVQRRSREAMLRTLRWAERSIGARCRGDQALFGIIQGGAIPVLRRESAERTAALSFDGFAHGGLGLGEASARRDELIAAAQEVLPIAAPRYLMGIGRPADLLAAIAQGVDLFDCVLPTRNGRHGTLFTQRGVLRLRGSRYRRDPRPIEDGCPCPACQTCSRGYLHHLLKEKEILGSKMTSIHNLTYYLNLMRRAREAIHAGSFAAFAAAEIRNFGAECPG